jgi:poly-gamma-glutamate synthesis protein (capsule biosynthesis protein)
MRGAGAGSVAALYAVLALAACSATEPPARPSPSRSSQPSSEPTSPATTPEPARPTSVRIAVAGDVHFEGVLADRLRDPATALAPAARALAAADVAIANLETSVGTGGRPEPGKRFTFSAGPAAFTALAAAGVDVAVMANNHALDFGRARLPSTLRAAREAAGGATPLDVIGIGRDRDEAFAPAMVDVRGTRVATVAATVADQDPTADPTGQWAATEEQGGTADALDPTHLLAAVRQADAAAEVVVVYLHWGIQGDSCPSADQKRLAARVVGAGADVVVGSHAHVLQGDGRLGRGYVAYGLGNFAWYSPGRTGVLTLTLRPPGERTGHARVVHSAWEPARIGADGLAAPVGDAEAADFRADRQALRSCAGLTR